MLLGVDGQRPLSRFLKREPCDTQAVLFPRRHHCTALVESRGPTLLLWFLVVGD